MVVRKAMYIFLCKAVCMVACNSGVTHLAMSSGAHLLVFACVCDCLTVQPCMPRGLLGHERVDEEVILLFYVVPYATHSTFVYMHAFVSPKSCYHDFTSALDFL